MLETIYVEMNNPFPVYYNLYKHELDQSEVKIFFTLNGAEYPINITGTGDWEAQVSVTINDIIIDDDLTIINEGTTGINFNFYGYTLFEGLMKIEIKLTKDSRNYYPVAPILINITPSILDNASVTPESQGNIADLLQLYPTLSQWVSSGVDSIANSAYTNTPISGSNKLFTAGGAYTELDKKLNYVSLGTTSDASVFNNNTDTDKIYSTTYGGVAYRFFVVEGSTIQYRFSGKGVEARALNESTWTTLSIRNESGSFTYTSTSDENKTMTGTYNLIGNYCFMTASAEMTSGTTYTTYPLPVTSISDILCLGSGAGAHIVQAVGSNVSISRFDGSASFGVPVAFELTYKFQ